MKRAIKMRQNQRRRQQRNFNYLEIQDSSNVVTKRGFIDEFIASGQFEKTVKEFVEGLK